MPLPEQAYNLATGNKWLLVIPFNQIDSDLSVDTLSLNLTNFSIPELVIGEVGFPIRGRTMPLPTGVQDEDKSISFNYMLSSDWHQYKILYKWLNLISSYENVPQKSYDEILLDLSVYFLSEYKNPIFSMNFKGCWISRLGSIDLNYQSGEDNIQHDFSINYSLYEFEDLI